MRYDGPIPQMTPMQAALAFIVAFRSRKTTEEKERLAGWWNDDQRRKADHE